MTSTREEKRERPNASRIITRARRHSNVNLGEVHIETECRNIVMHTRAFLNSKRVCYVIQLKEKRSLLKQHTDLLMCEQPEMQ